MKTTSYFFLNQLFEFIIFIAAYVIFMLRQVTHSSPCPISILLTYISYSLYSSIWTGKLTGLIHIKYEDIVRMPIN